MREGGVGGVVTVRQNQFMFRTGSEFNFNTFILMNCKLSTRNQELSSKSFSRKARFQTPVRYLRQQFTFQERMLANLCGLIIAQGGPWDSDLQGERADTKKATIHSYTFCPTLAQLDEHKHGSCWEKKLLRKERDEDCTKATVVRTSTVFPLPRGTLKDSQSMHWGQGQRLSRALSHMAPTEHEKNILADEFIQPAGSWWSNHDHCERASERGSGCQWVTSTLSLVHASVCLSCYL